MPAPVRLNFHRFSFRLGQKVALVEGPIFVCGHRPKTKELLELFLFLLFTVWFISSSKEI